MTAPLLARLRRERAAAVRAMADSDELRPSVEYLAQLQAAIEATIAVEHERLCEAMGEDKGGRR